VSVALLSRAWCLKMPAAPKAVVLVCADEAGDDGMLPWPSMATLRLRTGLVAHEVRRAVRWLECAGMLRCIYVGGAFTTPDRAQLLLSDQPTARRRMHLVR
jgi:hypothetical protein